MNKLWSLSCCYDGYSWFYCAGIRAESMIVPWTASCQLSDFLPLQIMINYSFEIVLFCYDFTQSSWCTEPINSTIVWLCNFWAAALNLFFFHFNTSRPTLASDTSERTGSLRLLSLLCGKPRSVSHGPPFIHDGRRQSEQSSESVSKTSQEGRMKEQMFVRWGKKI